MKPQRSYRLDDYFFLEEGSTVRHEFFAGEIFAMDGGTVAHNQIAANVLRELGNALRGKPCRALGSDMRLATPGGLLTYPDAMVICGKVELAHGRKDLVTNPVLLVEVLSEATRAYDLGEKLDSCKAILALREYLALEQDTPRGAAVPAHAAVEEGDRNLRGCRRHRLVLDRRGPIHGRRLRRGVRALSPRCEAAA